jgi:uncharacterized membrane protein
MIEQGAGAAQPAARIASEPGASMSEEVLRSIGILEDQLEHFIGPVRRLPPAEIRNVNELADQRQTLGQRVADRFATVIGSWPFIISQSIILAVWIVLNVVAWVQHWDPYPFILLNLALSFQAAYSGPIIMMSQNRQNAKDRLAAEEDFRVNRVAEDEIRAIMTHLERQDEVMLHILERLERFHHTGRPVPSSPRALSTGAAGDSDESAVPERDGPGGVEAE